MVQYDKKIINALLDSYENSVLFTGDNKVNRSIQFPFNRKTIPAYFDESSSEYENIHIAMKELDAKGYVFLNWKKGKENHILSKVTLNIDKLEQIYTYVKRMPKAEQLEQNKSLLKDLQAVYMTPVCSAFLSYLYKRIENYQSVKEYIDIANQEETKNLLKGIYAVEQNKKQCYIREFSIEIFGDSKLFEVIIGKVVKVFRTFSVDCEGKDEEAILSEYGIYHTPNYVYLKGNVTVCIHNECIPVAALKQGIGISGEDIADIHLTDFSMIKCVMTIENLTTFFRLNEPDNLIIYLGGYHNSIRRTLLKRVYECLPSVKYYHFGDIDAGGFEIYRDLCEKTRIPFEMYQMDLATLRKYQIYGKQLTGNDRMRLKMMQEKILRANAEQTDISEGMRKGNTHKPETDRSRDLVELIQYMLENNVKLEQECIIDV